MSKAALGTLCHVVERLSELGALDTPTSFEGKLLEGAVREIRALQSEYATQEETLVDQLERKRRANDLIEAQAQKIQELCEVLARKSFEI